MSEPSEPTDAAGVGQGRRPMVRRPWPQLPQWFVVGVALSSVAIIGVLIYAVTLLARDPQPVAERRTPSSATSSHDVGRLELRTAVSRPVPCGAVSGLSVAGATEADVDLLDEVVRGVCKNIRSLDAFDAAAEKRVVTAARRSTLIAFAQFERTGEDSTTVTGTPPRVAVNTRFSVRGKLFKGYLAGVVLHELMHAGGPAGPVTAEDEYLTRFSENGMCRIVLPNSEIGRSCGDAKDIVDVGKDEAVKRLRAAGYP